MDALEQNIGYSFKNKELLKLALTHRSHNEGKRGNFADNESLEFLGDSVINLAVTEYLFKQFKQLKEGEMSKIKAHLISSSSLYNLAATVDLSDYILLGKGEEKNQGRQNKRIVASAFEALIGAIFLDSNFKIASTILSPLIKQFFDNYNIDDFKINDYKSELQEFIQKHQNILPVYKIVGQSGKPPEMIFTAVVYLESKEIGRGEGTNKRQAEQEAAMNALKQMDGLSSTEQLSKVFFLKN